MKNLDKLKLLEKIINQQGSCYGVICKNCLIYEQCKDESLKSIKYSSNMILIRKKLAEKTLFNYKINNLSK